MLKFIVEKYIYAQIFLSVCTFNNPSLLEGGGGGGGGEFCLYSTKIKFSGERKTKLFYFFKEEIRYEVN